MKKLLLVATCVAVMIPGFAQAAGVNDPDDTAGRLDIKYTGAHIVGDRLEFEVEMFRAWPNRLFRMAPNKKGTESSRRGQLVLYFDSRGDERADWNLFVDRENGRWIATICAIPHRGRGDIVCERAKAWREEPTSIQLSITPDQILKAGDPSYSWRAKTKLEFRKGCPVTGKSYCVDRSVGKQAD
ncbi:MAG: hypothetical protein QOK47_816 [Actinomycetota bacterium]|nr:hypothetical protein [Actinomycetota bacterium]